MQDILIALLLKRGFPWADDGICFGTAATAIEAFITGKESYEYYLETLGIINATESADEPTERINDFLDRVAFFQDPNKFPHLFSNPTEVLLQDLNLLTMLSKKEVLKISLDICEAASSTGVYSKKALALFLISYQKAAMEFPDARSGLLLSNLRHTFMLTYDVSKAEWILGNNGSFFIFHESKLKELTVEIEGVLGAFNEDMIFRTQIYTTKAQLEMGRSLAAAWGASDEQLKINVVTPEKASFQSSMDGATWLHAATESGNLDTMAFLLEEKASVNAATMENGCTPLHVAIGIKHTEAAELLIAAKAAVNATLLDGKTALHFAAIQYDCPKIIKLLIESHADLQAQHMGQTPLALAIQHKQQQTASLLKHYAASTKEAIPLSDAKPCLLSQSTDSTFSIANAPDSPAPPKRLFSFGKTKYHS